MREQGTRVAAFYAIPAAGGILVYLLGRILGFSHALAAVGAVLATWYFNQTAQKLHFDYFRD